MVAVNWLVSAAAALFCAPGLAHAEIDLMGSTNDSSDMRICIEGASGERTDVPIDERIKACTALSEVAGHAFDGIYYRGLLHREQQDWEAAYADFDTAVKLRDDVPSAWYFRGWIALYKRNAPDPALRDLSKAIELTKDDPRHEYFIHRAVAHSKAATVNRPQTEYDLDGLRAALADIETYLLLHTKATDKEMEMAVAFKAEVETALEGAK